MYEDSKICPYTGLRPFSEDESLYFKGRDENIEQATRQLEKNKFLILTGASGDGKSSLIFAGVIPNARAGFLKSRFSNWAVADFRPERTPFKNLCLSIASQLGIPNTETVEAELSRGFSALVDLYKASSLWYDESEIQWQQTDPQEQAKIKRKAANLIVLADQFEEFFTNPENYSKGIPSQEAALVTNILLETARISLEEKLPVYVVITMRSDFIGQCAAFRGLPEYIGFSQFFVPRLNRKQLQEVIEEPAVLSGNSISRRLTERLIEDLTEGTDQLPILQHALNQIWKKASEKDEEMDLIHYAMVGGMDPKELPSEDSIRFNQWFNALPIKIRNCYDRPGLHNVLNTHANIITNQIADYVYTKSGFRIADDESRLIVGIVFKCLTKINQGRAVRNRMTLLEITQILNRPDLDTLRVASVLDIFRDADNTLLKPFIAELPELQDETILDITHESLIRNWRQLGEWADEEFENYTIFLDFRQQLERWTTNNKSADFLLSIGPLTYFENWFNKAKPNQFWIARYEADHGQGDDKLRRSINLLKDAKDFLQRSTRKHFVTRTVMHYGPKKISLVLGAILFLTASSFMVNNYVQQQSSVVRNFIVDESLQYNNMAHVQQTQKVAAIDQQLRLGDVTARRILANAKNYKDKIDLAIQVSIFAIEK
ncbi:MAG TPA: hypothetical protein VFW11_04070, partial [Cyclobacteriaceae bacterium]|nr:hypothetical protein [Cyclobacteriaceae bacterium]